MTAPETSPLPLWQPGDVIEFADVREMMEFEDIVAHQVDPMLDEVLWATRPKLTNLLRDPKLNFNGNLANIMLTVMADPYEKLQTARERGLRVGSGKLALSSEFAAELIPRYQGFNMTAIPKSSRPGNLGQMQAELWYFPVPLTKSVKKAGGYGHQTRAYTSKKTGEVTYHTYHRIYKQDYVSTRKLPSVHWHAIRRVVSKPIMERELLTVSDADAKRIGFRVMQAAMRHPLSVPMQD